MLGQGTDELSNKTQDDLKQVAPNMGHELDRRLDAVGKNELRETEGCVS